MITHVGKLLQSATKEASKAFTWKANSIEANAVSTFADMALIVVEKARSNERKIL